MERFTKSCKFWMLPEDYERLKRYAKKNDRTISHFMRAAIREYLENNDKTMVVFK